MIGKKRKNSQTRQSCKRIKVIPAELPDEIWVSIFSYISKPRDVFSVKICCKKFKDCMDYAFDHSFNHCKPLLDNYRLGNKQEVYRLLLDKRVCRKLPLDAFQNIFYSVLQETIGNESLFLQLAQCYHMPGSVNLDIRNSKNHIEKRNDFAQYILPQITISLLEQMVDIINQKGQGYLCFLLFDVFLFSFAQRRMDLIQYIIENKLDKDFYSLGFYNVYNKGRIFVEKCVQARYKEGLEYLIEKRLDIFDYERRVPGQYFCDTTLTLAIKEKDFQMVKLLLSTGYFDPSFIKQGPLKCAIKIDSYEIVSLLLEDKRVDPSVHDQKLFEKACCRGNENIVSLLLSHPKIDPSLGGTDALLGAIENGHTGWLNYYCLIQG